MPNSDSPPHPVDPCQREPCTNGTSALLDLDYSSKVPCLHKDPSPTNRYGGEEEDLSHQLGADSPAMQCRLSPKLPAEVLVLPTLRL